MTWTAGPAVWGLPVLAWAGNAVLLLLVLCGGLSWWSARSSGRKQRLALFWASLPWLATAALALVTGTCALMLRDTWAVGAESGWAKVRVVADAWSELLPAHWLSLAFALGAWSLLVSWPTLLGLDRRGRRVLALGLVCFWLGLGFAAWSCHEFLGKLPLALVPTFMPFDELEPSRVRLARGVLVAGAALALGASLAGWALWRAPERVTTRSQQWLGTLGVVLLGGCTSFGLERLGTDFAWENANPLDTSFAFANCSLCLPPALGLEGRGPHEVVQAPHVVLKPPHWTIDGSAARDFNELFDVLKNKRELWRMLNPGDEFPGNVVLSARGLRTGAELEAALSTVLSAGYPKAHLLYTEVLLQERPLLRVFGRRDTTLRLFLARGLSDCPTPHARAIHMDVAAQRSGPSWLNELGRVTGNICVILPAWQFRLQYRNGVMEAGIEVIDRWSLGKRVEAAEFRRGQQRYLVAFVEPESAISVELMNDPMAQWDGLEALEARTRRTGQRVVWAMNGGMYHSDRSPVGLLVSASQERSALNTRHGKGNFFLKPNGLFEVSARGNANVWTTGAWQADSFSSHQPKEATQSGPMLVINGALHPAFERDSPSRLIRNGIGVVTGSNMVVMAISNSRVNFYEFAALMRDLGCDNALYLDGNVSSVFAPGAGRRDRGLGLGPVVVVRERSD